MHKPQVLGSQLGQQEATVRGQCMCGHVGSNKPGACIVASTNAPACLLTYYFDAVGRLLGQGPPTTTCRYIGAQL